MRPSIKFIQSQKKTDLIGVEIGVFEGDHALEILHNLSINTLFLIDPYKPYEGYNDLHKNSILGARGKAHIKLFPFHSKIVWIQTTSEEAAKGFKQGLDFVYIDGNHTYEYVKKDIEKYWPAIKEGGVLCGHDYGNDGSTYMPKVPLNWNVKKAVDEFVEKNNLKVFVDDVDWWIIK